MEFDAQSARRTNLSPVRILLAVAQPVTLLTLFPLIVAGVCPQPSPPVCAEFFHSDAVFIGEVVSKRPVLDVDNFYVGWFYRIRVKKFFRGEFPRNIEVFMANDSGRLSFDLHPGQRYLLFASHWGGDLTFNTGCGSNAAPLSEAGNALRQIEEIKTATSGGEIMGRVSEQSDISQPISGVHILVEGIEGHYESTSASDGWFHLRVPAGRYVVRAPSADRALIPFDLSYDDPEHIVIENGGCAAIQFVATPVAPHD